MLRNTLLRLLTLGLLGFSIYVPSGASADQQPLSDNDLRIYKKAFKLAHRLRFDKALKRAETAENPLPAKIIRWMYLKTRKSNATFDTIKEFLVKNPDWPHRRSLRRRAEEVMPKDWTTKAILQWYEQNPPMTAKGAAQHAKAMIASGDTEAGYKVIRNAWVNRNFSYKSARVFRRKHRKVIRQKDHVARLHRLLWDDKVSAARRQLRLVGKDQQRLAFARIQLIVRAPGVDYAVARVPQHLSDDIGLIYDRIRWRRRRGLIEKAYELMQKAPVDGLPRADKWGTERRFLARWALREGNYSAAYKLAKDHGQIGRLERAEAEWLAGWIALRFVHRYADAFDHFKALFNEVQYPISQSRAAYWAGRAADAANLTGIASRWYRIAAIHNTRFYGQLAASHLPENERLALPQQPQPTKTNAREFRKNEIVKILMMLNQLGEKKLVRQFISHLIRTNKNSRNWVMLAQLASTIGRGDYAIHAARYALRQGIVLTNLGYPNLKTATDPELDPALVHGLVRQESAFRQHAVSRAGARGLMQLMPHTAKLVSRKLRIKYSRARLLLDPAYNIRLGQTYLKQMLNQFNGSVIMALTAYNAGPHRVRRLIRTLGQPGPSVLDMVDWIEQIPFTETRNYVQRVLENRTVYHSRTNDIRVASFLDEKFKIAAAAKAKKPILVPIFSEEAARVRKADQIFKKDVEK
ncbi:MAG: lytic murein transglycosylase [Rhodospirillaceae bacterium]|nr:lytic murein transglycosylase [Rhodospirillaceae bacterium]